MSRSPAELSIDAPRGEPLAAWFSAARADGPVDVRRFEFASHGDLVSGRSWQPRGTAVGWVLAVHPLGARADVPAVAAAAHAWARAGFATAAIDLPLHGERHNAKLSARAIAARTPAHADHALWRSLIAQAVRDLARALDALATLGPLGPVACVAFGDTAPIAAAFAALDARVGRAAWLGPLEAGASPEASPLARLARPEDLRV